MKEELNMNLNDNKNLKKEKNTLNRNFDDYIEK